jgi:hypothetical protein
MNRDVAAVLVLVLAFATYVTAHVTLAFGLGYRRPRWRALVALVIAPLAPWWGWRAKMRARSVLWIASVVVYVAAWIASDAPR